MHINNSLLAMPPSYESIKSNAQALKWAEETYFSVMNFVKKPINVHKDSLSLLIQAFTDIHIYIPSLICCIFVVFL